ncbi:MAG: Snf7 family protein [Candidatus Helarchaeota archaeon]|nr:Snf7 family protein [Candidatus Helarchaeota archaeon]
MGAWRKFVSWLKGANLNDIIFRVDVFTRKLDRQRKQLEKEARNNRTKAKKYQLDGNSDSARLYAQHYVKYNKWAIGVDTYRLHIMNLLMKLKQSQAVAETAKILGGITNALGALRSAVRTQNVAQLVDNIDSQIEHFEMTQEIAEGGLEEITVSTEVKDSDVQRTMDEINQEIAVETGVALPTTPADSRISKLEDEIRRIKEER